MRLIIVLAVLGGALLSAAILMTATPQLMESLLNSVPSSRSTHSDLTAIADIRIDPDAEPAEFLSGALTAKVVISAADPGSDTAPVVFNIVYPTDNILWKEQSGRDLQMNSGTLNTTPDPWDVPVRSIVTPVIGYSCLQTVNSEPLTANRILADSYRKYLVCRHISEFTVPEGEDFWTPEKGGATAVVGILWPLKHRLPLEQPKEKCIEEVRIWVNEIAKAGDRFAICIVVTGAESSAGQAFVFEITPDNLVLVPLQEGMAAERWNKKQMKTRDSHRLAQYRLGQAWLADPELQKKAVDEAKAQIAQRNDRFGVDRDFKLRDIEVKDYGVNLRIQANNPGEVRKDSDAAWRRIFYLSRPVICHSDETGAMLFFIDFQSGISVDVVDADGKLMLSGPFEQMRCDSYN